MATGRRRGRAIFYIAFILILILVLVVVVARFNPLAKKGTDSNGTGAKAATVAPTADVIEIVVTTQDVKRGQELREDLLALVAVPRKDYTEGVFFKDKKALVGARAKFDLPAHTPLTNALIFSAGKSGSVPSLEIPPGKVAISVPISKLSSVAYGIQKGDHVNIIVSLLMVDTDTNFQSKTPNRTGIVIAPGPIDENQTYVTAVLRSPPGYEVTGGDAYSYLGRIEIDPTMNNPVYVLPSEPQRPRLVSQTLIQDVVILQLGTFTQVAEPVSVSSAPIQQPGEATATRAPARTTQQQATAEPTKIPDVVTLIVSPQDAVTLNYLMLAGANLNMVLRSAGDSEIKTTEAVTLQFVLDQYQIPNPAKLPYGLEPRMDKFPDFIQPFPDPAAVATPTKEK
jgi:pilus assembly protein CpaB